MIWSSEEEVRRSAWWFVTGTILLFIHSSHLSISSHSRTKNYYSELFTKEYRGTDSWKDRKYTMQIANSTPLYCFQTNQSMNLRLKYFYKRYLSWFYFCELLVIILTNFQQSIHERRESQYFIIHKVPVEQNYQTTISTQYYPS